MRGKAMEILGVIAIVGIVAIVAIVFKSRLSSHVDRNGFGIDVKDESQGNEGKDKTPVK